MGSSLTGTGTSGAGKVACMRLCLTVETEEAAEEGIGRLGAFDVDVLPASKEGVTALAGLGFLMSGVLSAMEVGYLRSGVAARGISLIGAGTSGDGVNETGDAVIRLWVMGEGERAF